jgi:uncharacterized protein YegL
MSATNKDMLVLPKLDYIARDLNIFLLTDESRSMSGKRIATLNHAILESTNELKEVGKQHPEASFKIRAIAFSDSPRWHIGPDPVDIDKLSWQDLSVDGGTETGAAIQWLADAVTMDKMSRKGFPPVMVLLSDGDNTDGDAYEQAIARLNSEPWGRKAIRIAIGIGDGYNRTQLEKFTNRPDIGVLEAKNTVDLANYVKFAIVTVSLSAINSVSDPDGKNSGTNVYVAGAPASAASDPNAVPEVI